MDAIALRSVFGALRQTVHSPVKQARHTPWAGKPLMEIGGRSEDEAAKIIGEWIENGVLAKAEYYHAKSKNAVSRVILDEAKAAEILVDLEVISEPVE